ncbi:MAG: SusD/RagB family nutrient-binding outer membrane lipoprotein [Chitinophagaceae bacterium]|nr:MAG: SusD/RagB family nutrient-binding outer membrane lipoprotein [Chitinophagaceae bacterium]
MVKKKIIIALAAGVITMATSCSRDKFNINSNPDDITTESVLAPGLLPSGLTNTATVVARNWDFLNMWLGHWARNGNYQSITPIETYQFTTTFKDEIWEDVYLNNGNYNLMQQKAKEQRAGFYEAVARVMKVHNFQLLADIYGNIPYFDAFGGIKVKTPQYSTGQEVYTDLFKQLDTAVTVFNTPAAIADATNPDKTTNDLLFKGDAKKWLKFINTLRLRLIIHLHNGLTTTQVVPGFDIPDQVARITPEGFIGSGETASINPGYNLSKPNPYWREFVRDETGTPNNVIYKAGKYAIDYYKANNDPRIDRFYVKGANGQAGAILGRPADGNPLYNEGNLSSNRGPGLMPAGNASNAWIITSVESFFLQAEAAERGILPGDPKALLNAAIGESFVYLGLTKADANAYIAANEGFSDVDYDAPPAGAGLPGGGMYTILSQKWFALNSIAPYELWTDYRRTDFVLGAAAGYAPGPPISIDPGNTHTHIPIRLFYPQDEYNYNAVNVKAQGTIDVFNTRIFWDLN